MIKVAIFTEGQTELIFVRNLLDGRCSAFQEFYGEIKGVSTN